MRRPFRLVRESGRYALDGDGRQIPPDRLHRSVSRAAGRRNVGIAPHTQHGGGNFSDIVAVRKAAAGKDRCHGTDLPVRRIPSPVQKTAIGAHYGIHVVRTFHSALDLQRFHARCANLADMPRKAHVLEGQRILAAVIHHAARLCALAAVAAPSAHHGAEQALSRMAHAHGAVDEHLDADG